MLHARSLAPLVSARDFGMTPVWMREGSSHVQAFVVPIACPERSRGVSKTVRHEGTPQLWWCKEWGTRPPFLLPIKHKDVLLILPSRAHSDRQCLAIRRKLDLASVAHFPIVFVSDFHCTIVHSASRGDCGWRHIRSHVWIIFPVEFQGSRSSFHGSIEGKAVGLVGRDLKLVGRIHLLGDAVPRGCEA